MPGMIETEPVCSRRELNGLEETAGLSGSQPGSVKSRHPSPHQAARKILELTPHATVAKLVAGPFRDYQLSALFVEGWRKAGLPEN